MKILLFPNVQVLLTDQYVGIADSEPLVVVLIGRKSAHPNGIKVTSLLQE
jgi:hypothetical protein